MGAGGRFCRSSLTGAKERRRKALLGFACLRVRLVGLLGSRSCFIFYFKKKNNVYKE